MKKHQVRVAIIDDHQLLIDGIKSLLENHEKFLIVADSTDPQKLLCQLHNIPVEILLMCVLIPKPEDIRFLKEVSKSFPNIKMMVLVMYDEDQVVNERKYDIPIVEYVFKNSGKEELLNAMEKLANDIRADSTEMLNDVFEDDFQDIKTNGDAHLTSREIEIIRLIEQEMSNKEIADNLTISERTVETHRKNIFRKTKTNSLIGLMKYAYQHKLVDFNM